MSIDPSVKQMVRDSLEEQYGEQLDENLDKLQLARDMKIANEDEDEDRDCMMTTKEQIEALLEENYNKYPDAINWMMTVYCRTKTLPVSKYEKFMEQLNGNGEFQKIPAYDPQTHNIVHMIKAYRAEHGVGLKEAKDRIDWYVANHHFDQLPRSRQLTYQHLKDF